MVSGKLKDVIIPWELVFPGREFVDIDEDAAAVGTPKSWQRMIDSQSLASKSKRFDISTISLQSDIGNDGDSVKVVNGPQSIPSSSSLYASRFECTEIGRQELERPCSVGNKGSSISARYPGSSSHDNLDSPTSSLTLSPVSTKISPNITITTVDGSMDMTLERNDKENSLDLPMLTKSPSDCGHKIGHESEPDICSLQIKSVDSRLSKSHREPSTELVANSKSQEPVEQRNFADFVKENNGAERSIKRCFSVFERTMSYLKIFGWQLICCCCLPSED